MINCLAETSWMQGGSRPQIPQGIGNVTGVSGQIILHSQTLTGKVLFTSKIIVVKFYCVKKVSIKFKLLIFSTLTVIY